MILNSILNNDAFNSEELENTTLLISTQSLIETISSDDPNLRLTSIPLEFVSSDDPNLRLTSIPLEFVSSDNPNLYATQSIIEFIYTNHTLYTRSISQSLSIFHGTTVTKLTGRRNKKKIIPNSFFSAIYTNLGDSGSSEVTIFNEEIDYDLVYSRSLVDEISFLQSISYNLGFEISISQNLSFSQSIDPDTQRSLSIPSLIIFSQSIIHRLLPFIHQTDTFSLVSTFSYTKQNINNILFRSRHQTFELPYPTSFIIYPYRPHDYLDQIGYAQIDYDLCLSSKFNRISRFIMTFNLDYNQRTALQFFLNYYYYDELLLTIPTLIESDTHDWVVRFYGENRDIRRRYFTDGNVILELEAWPATF